jgi:hypothetical protein
VAEVVYVSIIDQNKFVKIVHCKII